MERAMGIGVGLVLVAVGAVLTFAVNAVVSGVNLQTIGVILMIVGAVGVAIDLFIFAPRRRSVTTYSNGAGPEQGVAPGTRVTRVEP